MDIKTNNDRELTELLKSKIDEIKSRIEFYQDIIDNLEDQLYKAEDAYEAFLPKAKTISNVNLANTTAVKLTTALKAEVVIGEAGEFLTTGEIVALINSKYTDHPVVVESFNAQWPAIWRDSNKPFRRIKYNISKTEVRYLFGMKEWFDEKGGILSKYKKPLQEKIPSVEFEVA